MYGVVLVDDEQIILQGLQRVFPWGDYGLEVKGTASDGKEGLQLIRQCKPDMLLTDIRMPNMDGLSMIAALGSEFPRMQISVLTAFRDFDYAKEAIRLGVCRYLLKPSKMDELKEAVGFMTENLRALPPLEETVTDGEETGEAGNYVARAAMQYIKEHFEEHISLSDVAEHVYVSPWHLSKLINGHLGQSFFDILNGLRISKAKELLMDPALKVHEIAIQIGYGDVAHFSKNFKKATGQSPMEFRSGGH
ncbi:MAG: response regulator [Eubacteriales bacterium]|nr:response regulator [Eubacteriales bacterium]